ncbi:endospore germination permease [Hazenella sp. IB182357]|uniref:Endospore germination permease n=1 Tax=Polycladospora coralii TaxID=2771432 RepID=A0A926N863_9BACL|nr:endospore germination permease [Polycladospora coralii]
MGQNTRESQKYSISSYQSFVLLFSTIFGAGVLDLPRNITDDVGNDTIWVLFIAGLLVWCILMLITVLIQRFPQESIAEYLIKILGSKRFVWIGRILSVLLLIPIAGAWLAGSAMITRTFGETVHIMILTETPLLAIMVPFVLLVCLAGCSQISVLAKFSELLFPLSLIPIGMIIFSTLIHGRLLNVLPLMGVSWEQLISGVLTSAYAFTGYTVVLVFSGFYQQPKKALKVHSLAFGFTFLLYWGLCVNTLAVFGPEEVTKMMWPVLEAAKILQIPVLIERMESIILLLWVSTAFTSAANLYVAFVEMVCGSLKWTERWRKGVAILFSFVILGIALYPDRIQEIWAFQKWYGAIALGIAICIPLLLLMIALIRKQKGEIKYAKKTSSH